MQTDLFGLTAASPLALLVCAAIVVIALVLYLRWRTRWSRAGHATSARGRDLALLAVSTLAALLLVVGADMILQERDKRARMQAELEQRSADAATLRARIDAELAAARALLAEQAIEKIGQGRLVQARADLARFAQFRDANILRMIELIDRELATRASPAPAPVASQ